MTRFAHPLSLPDLLDRVSTICATDVGALILSMPLDLRLRSTPDSVFVSGLAADLIELLAGATGAAVTCGADKPVLWIRDEWIVGSAPSTLRIGPVAFDHEFEGGTPIDIVTTAVATTDDLQLATILRARLSECAERLLAGVAEPFDADKLSRLGPDEQEHVADAFRTGGRSRSLVGAALIDAGERFDDERLDQLGDAYDGVADAWNATAADPSALEELLRLERACAELMSVAAQRPTRYAF